ncbi:ribonuclease H-like domain-containing protein [Chaetomidium leptoderma]|uniref:Ribonuclease H-like domain-containing protein n=1 Tax=Chaetomidium leptoderma TaxID=669021 RepID=A0AAN6VS06_9PEZI|nr:ribonuclease H-like domain-containing protein [Chaetomidium leptoderma]
MTGVSGHSASKTLEHTEASAYHRAAEAARTFQILQIGLTCLSHTGYRARTFTFHLTPEFVPPNTALAKLIDRKLVLSYRSFLFLKENNFSFDKAFSQGVPYLSRSEGAEAIRWEQGGRQQQGWDGEYKQRHDSIVRQTGKQTPSHTPHLPGFRYVIEALVGGPFANAIDPELLMTDDHHNNNNIQGDTNKKAAKLTQLRLNLRLYEQRLKKRRPVLIGHNPFLDLCFLHETFLRPLPPDAAAFRRAINKDFFPRIIDTKYLSSQVPGSRTGKNKNLEQLFYEVVNHKDFSPIVPEPGFDARNNGCAAAAHNAGFDSWMTAVVFVGLARKMVMRDSSSLRRGPQGGGGGGIGKEEAPGSSSGRRRDDGSELFRELSPFAAGGGSWGSAESGPAAAAAAAAAAEFIPPWECEVWRKYGNKLRLGGVGGMDLTRW